MEPIFTFQNFAKRALTKNVNYCRVWVKMNFFALPVCRYFDFVCVHVQKVAQRAFHRIAQNCDDFDIFLELSDSAWNFIEG